jgi:hypothetical protein
MYTGQGASPTRGGSVFVRSPVRRLAPMGGEKNLLPPISTKQTPLQSTGRGRVSGEGALHLGGSCNMAVTMEHPYPFAGEIFAKGGCAAQVHSALCAARKSRTQETARHPRCPTAISMLLRAAGSELPPPLLPLPLLQLPPARPLMRDHGHPQRRASSYTRMHGRAKPVADARLRQQLERCEERLCGSAGDGSGCGCGSESGSGSAHATGAPVGLHGLCGVLRTHSFHCCACLCAAAAFVRGVWPSWSRGTVVPQLQCVEAHVPCCPCAWLPRCGGACVAVEHGHILRLRCWSG